MAINTQTLEGRWNEIRGKLHERWGQLTDDDLNQARGSIEQLIGTIQRKTGEAQEKIRSYLEQLTGDGQSSVQQAAAKARESMEAANARAREMSQQAAEQAQRAAEEALAQMRATFENTPDIVLRRPLDSIASCFALGLISGVVVGMMLRSR